MTQTLDYYNRNAEAFFQTTAYVDMAPLYERFIKHVTPRGHILDAGCGSGRDSKAFKEMGFRVSAFDASSERHNHFSDGKSITKAGRLSPSNAPSFINIG
ncbi:MAG: hypothetical protein RLZZ369_90, partial [Pseudomonadota bacterium]